ncbi:MAG: hypothetical protein ACKO1M_04660 [Planctomycetota bacterium]
MKPFPRLAARSLTALLAMALVSLGCSKPASPPATQSKPLAVDAPKAAEPPAAAAVPEPKPEPAVEPEPADPSATATAGGARRHMDS